MRGVSIALALRLALIGLTAALIVIAALGVASLYGARAEYESALLQTYQLEAAASRLLAAGVVEQTAALASGPGDQADPREARAAFQRQAAAARRLAGGDPESTRLVEARVAVQDRLRELDRRPSNLREARSDRRDRAAATRDARALTNDLAARQQDRRVEAGDRVADDTRTAALTIALAGLLALLAALFLVRDLAGRMRRPLDELVVATRRLAGGDLSGRVHSRGPRELRALGDSFNGMADDLRGARRRIEDERRKLATTIASLGDGVVVCDREGVVTAFNPRAAALIPELRVGQPAGSGKNPLPSLEEALEGEVMLEHAERTVAVTAAALETGGGGTVWTMRDISERARLERMKSDFVAAASHELRSPLTSIKGFVELLSRSEELSSKQRESVDVIRISTDRLVDLVEDLLEVARIEAGRIAIDLRPIDLAHVANQAITLMEPRLAEKRQRLELAIEPSLPFAYADAARVQEIVENLLTNAHLYTGEAGEIRVSCGADGPETVALAVADTGRGMTREELSHAFDRFYRGVQESELAPGTGLGLWIVKSLVELQHGSIEVTSEPGAGSTFVVRLPSAGAGANGAPSNGARVEVASRQLTYPG